METNTVEATKANVDAAVNNIKKYAEEKGYQIIGEFKEEGFLSKLLSKDLEFDSQNKKKVCRNYLTLLERKMKMSTANKFLSFLYKKVYKLEKAPKIEYSEKELKIKESRKAWKKVQIEADKLLAAYKLEKGDFYKK